MVSEPKKFLATIYKIWMMRHVDVPPNITDALIQQLQASKQKAVPKKRTQPKPKHIPVIAVVNHCSTRTTLVPAGAGQYRLQINTALRKAGGGADAGDVIGVALQLDTAPRDIAVPAELKSALKQHPKARKEFDELPPGHRRQLLLYYLRAKSPKARAHLTERFLDHLHERALLRQPKPKRKPKPAAARSK
jgi:hypothetical protein